MTSLFSCGKYQYTYSSKYGKISLIKLKDTFGCDWEMYCLEGNLFRDIEKFKTKREAVIKIKELLGVKI